MATHGSFGHVHTNPHIFETAYFFYPDSCGRGLIRVSSTFNFVSIRKIVAVKSYFYQVSSSSWQWICPEIMQYTAHSVPKTEFLFSFILASFRVVYAAIRLFGFIPVQGAACSLCDDRVCSVCCQYGKTSHLYRWYSWTYTTKQGLSLVDSWSSDLDKIRMHPDRDTIQ